jgi:DNA-binding NarL/FixJ family response regulator
MHQTISLAVVADHKFFGECLISMLRECDDLSVCDLLRNETDVLHRMKVCPPDVVLIDRHLADQTALKLTRHLSQHYPDVKVLIFGITEAEPEIRECVESGAQGYVSKEASFSDLRQIIELAARGETICAPHVTQALFSHLSALAQAPWNGGVSEPMPLTARELEILYHISKGWSNSEIADHLFLSLHTVKNHVHNILKKLQVQRRLEAVEYANKHSWLSHRYR